MCTPSFGIDSRFSFTAQTRTLTYTQLQMPFTDHDIHALATGDRRCR